MSMCSLFLLCLAEDVWVNLGIGKFPTAKDISNLDGNIVVFHTYRRGWSGSAKCNWFWYYKRYKRQDNIFEWYCFRAVSKYWKNLIWFCYTIPKRMPKWGSICNSLSFGKTITVKPCFIRVLNIFMYTIRLTLYIALRARVREKCNKE